MKLEETNKLNSQCNKNLQLAEGMRSSVLRDNRDPFSVSVNISAGILIVMLSISYTACGDVTRIEHEAQYYVTTEILLCICEHLSRHTDCDVANIVYSMRRRHQDRMRSSVLRDNRDPSLFL
ncbi:hypothetical protein J6590_056949 [Homalodisca vitripennis]|nr:hypothetical protein J6590_056949 [Homalodisca vitripennis]